jgi:hypothetical protein
MEELKLTVKNLQSKKYFFTPLFHPSVLVKQYNKSLFLSTKIGDLSKIVTSQKLKILFMTSKVIGPKIPPHPCPLPPGERKLFLANKGTTSI